MEDLVTAVRRSLQKPTGYRVFYGSGLNVNDVRSYWSNLTAEEQVDALHLYNKSFKTTAHNGKEIEDEKLLAMFNALLDTSSNVSHLCNAYVEEVTAIFHRNPILEADLLKVPINLPNDSELSEIDPGSYLAKNRKHGMYNRGVAIPSTYSPLEYLTVVTSNNKIIASNKVVLANYSFIITREGHLVRQKYGEPNKFVDENGKTH